MNIGRQQAASSDDFADWLAREMPPGTIISDPRWWAPRILRQIGYIASSTTPASAQAVGDAMVATIPHGTFACPICGLDSPHHHEPGDRQLKERMHEFERAYTKAWCSVNPPAARRSSATPRFVCDFNGFWYVYLDGVVQVAWLLFQSQCKTATHAPGVESLPAKWRKEADECPNTCGNEDRGYSNAQCQLADELEAALTAAQEGAQGERGAD